VNTFSAAEVESESTNQPKGRKRKRTKAAETKPKAKGKKKRGIKDSDEDDTDEDDDTYTAPSRLVRCTAGSKPAPGSFAFCADCEARFTVVRFFTTTILRVKPLSHAYRRRPIQWRLSLVLVGCVMLVRRQAAMTPSRNLRLLGRGFPKARG